MCCIRSEISVVHSAGSRAQGAFRTVNERVEHEFEYLLSGPLLDRIDLHIEVSLVKFREMTGEKPGETSAQIRERVVIARKLQRKRFAHKPKITCNARMGSRELKSFCAIDDATVELLKFAMTDMNLSARAYDRILKVARTIPDPAGSENIRADHVSEAIQYRSLDRQLWT